MKNESIVFLSSDDWGWKTSKYQLSTRFARQNRVLFVSSIGFRAPTASRSDMGRIWRKLKGFVQGPKKVADNIWVLTPVVIPFGTGAFVRWLNRVVFSVQYTIALKFLKLGKPHLFVFSQNWGPYIKSLQSRQVIYYCVDDQSHFHGVNRSYFEEWDQKITAFADHVFCSARKLYEQKRSQNSNTHYLPHGVNWKLFSSALNGAAAGEDPDMERMVGPVLLFFGHISHDWVDADLVRFVATSRPDWNVVLVGRNAIDEDEFSGHPNIHLLGERDYEELPSLCRYADIGIIPFVSSDLTAACNPLKLYEYLAAGLPVVSTDIPEVHAYADTIGIATSPASFIARCDAALKIDRTTYSPHASELVRQHDWDDRVEHIYSVIA